MARHKAAKNCDIKPWLSLNPDCKEGRFLQAGNSLFLSRKDDSGNEKNRFLLLSNGAKMLYLCMALESGGKREFQFPQRAAKKYGIASSSLRRYIDELIRYGFIDRDSGWTTREANNYTFSLKWKEPGNI